MAPWRRDGAVLTLEVPGGELGIDTDTGRYRHFRAHHGAWFPALPCVGRTTGARQAATLWAVKGRLWPHLLPEGGHAPARASGDSVPGPICRFARARRCRRRRPRHAAGKDRADHRTFYGRRAHLRLGWPGVIAAALRAGAAGWVLGARNSWRPAARTPARGASACSRPSRPPRATGRPGRSG
jgi:hypothetical protein